MRAKRLPMKYPIVTSWQWQANSFAILANYPQTEPWIMSHFIQLELTMNEGKSFVDFYRTPTFEFCPWLFHQRLKRETVRYFNEDICSFIMDCIDMNNYVYGVFVQSFILEIGEFFSHDMFIYGYDEHKRIFHVADFTFKGTGAYSFAEVSFDQLEKAYHDIDESRDWLFTWKGGLSLISFDGRSNYAFNMGHVVEQFQGFLTGSNAFEKSRELTYETPPCVFGLEVYGKLLEDLEKIRAGCMEADYKPFHVIFDHKSLMLERIDYMDRHRYLQEASTIRDQYQSIANDALLARNLIVKYTLSNNGEIIDKVFEKIREIQKSEKEIIERILDRLVAK
ncbi:hypothetical protein GE107_24710 [Cohnella sp. CFH 77786]|uniref:hypothetical protein n=1 Tax=Cohnella sp. CFH 77786 TaxID=2662265 RepID=UPI001C60F4B4|nr:hypothetical protein [Cohnella sp. CFH 77786]MBW5449231.1 hypothetical protein [Cohnella sp. CFH 77786]